MDWKETVSAVSEIVFPGITEKIHNKVIENEVMSNLPLQMALYFNVILFPFWCLIITILLYDKFHQYEEFTKFVMGTIIIAVTFVEVLRLYLGYEGNLRDKIPELAGFWMLSILLQFPLQSFLLLNPYLQLRVMDKIVQAIMHILLLVQLISGYKALKYTSKQQAIYFKIMKLRNVKEDKYKTN